MNEDSTKELSQVIRIDDERVQNYLRNAVRGSVEETLNAMLEAEAEHLCNVGRYERTEARRDTRAGSYSRKLQTQAGQVTLKVPKLRLQTDVRDGNHRALPTTGELSRGGLDRDVLGGCFGAAGGRYHGSVVGHPSEPPRRCPTSIKRSTPASRLGGRDRSRPSTRTSISTESC
jgi:Transposase, Mutator family